MFNIKVTINVKNEMSELLLLNVRIDIVFVYTTNSKTGETTAAN